MAVIFHWEEAKADVEWRVSEPGDPAVVAKAAER